MTTGDENIIPTSVGTRGRSTVHSAFFASPPPGCAAKRKEVRILRDAADRLEEELAEEAPTPKRARKAKRTATKHGQTQLPVHGHARKAEA